LHPKHSAITATLNLLYWQPEMAFPNKKASLKKEKRQDNQVPKKSLAQETPIRRG